MSNQKGSKGNKFKPSLEAQERHSVCVILPALNEELTVGKVIADIPRQKLESEGYRVEVLVVDGNSTDHTREIAETAGAMVLVEPRRGKGRAMRTAFETVKADFLVMLDADYTYPPEYIPDMLLKLRQGYPVVIGSRLRGKREKGAIKPLNVIGNLLLTAMAVALYQSRISDVCTGCWGMRSEIIPTLDLTTDGFQLEVELFSQLARKHYRIGEIPIYYRRRPNKPKLGSIRDGLRIGWTLISKRFHKLDIREPLKTKEKTPARAGNEIT